MTLPQSMPFFSAAADFAGGTDTPREFLERCLARLESFEPAVGAFVCHDIAAARAAADRSAARWRDGRPLSPIDGMPLGIKDIIETADMPTEQGSPLFVGCRTGRDAASVAALREAGAVILGKVVTTEFAATEPRGTRNPWDRERTPGGSSSGSAAAVACGMVPAALGTQVVGSILRPASFCGCVGFKPSVGRINRGGSYDYFSQSCTGVLAASLEDAWLVAVNITARAGGDPGYPGLQGPAEPPTPRRPRALAVLRTSGWEEAAPEARAAFEAAVARLADAGIALADRHADPVIEEVEEAIADAAPLTRTINAWEGRWPLNTYRDRDATKLSRSALERLAMAEAMSLTEYGAAITVRQHNRETHARLAARYDAAIILAAPGAAPVGLGSPATRSSTCLLPCSVFPPCRYHCSRSMGCRWGCRSPVLSVRTPHCSGWRPRSAICLACWVSFFRFFFGGIDAFRVAHPGTVAFGRGGAGQRRRNDEADSERLRVRCVMLTDRYGLTVSTASSAACDAYVEGCEAKLTAYPGAVEAFDRAIAADPRFALAYAAKAHALLEHGEAETARASIKAAKSLVSGVSPREASHFAFFDLLLAGEAEAALSALRAHLDAWPRDAVVLATAAFTNGLIGSSGRAGQKRTLLEFLDTLAPSWGDDGWFTAHHGMALSENGERDAARPKIERSLAQNPKNPWAAHAWAHLCYEAGDPQAGRAFLASWLPRYPRTGPLYSHLSWHLALADLEAGDPAAASRLFREAFAPDVRGKVTDPVSFLWRWELAGRPRNAEAWRLAHAYAAGAFPRAGVAFCDLHIALAQVVAGDAASLETRSREIGELGHQGRYSSGPLVPAGSRAFAAFEQRDFAAAINTLEPIVDELERIGGSRAQLDLVEFTLLQAYINADRVQDAQRMVRNRRRGSSRPPVAGLPAVQ